MVRVKSSTSSASRPSTHRSGPAPNSRRSWRRNRERATAWGPCFVQGRSRGDPACPGAGPGLKWNRSPAGLSRRLESAWVEWIGGWNCDDLVPPGCATPRSLHARPRRLRGGPAAPAAAGLRPGRARRRRRWSSASTRRRSASAGRGAGSTSPPMTTSCAAWGSRSTGSTAGGGCVLHLPGQLAAYLALPLAPPRLDLQRYLDGLHAAIVGVLAEFDLPGDRRPDSPGVFLGEARVASVGVAVNRWIAYHGLTLNVGPFLEPFEPDRRAGPGSARSPLRQTSMEARRQRPAPMAQGPRGADPPGRGGLRARAAPRLHAPSPDPPEGLAPMSTLKALDERARPAALARR